MKSLKQVLLGFVIFAYFIAIIMFLISSGGRLHILPPFIYILAFLGNLGGIIFFSFGIKRYQVDKRSDPHIVWYNHAILLICSYCLLQGLVLITWAFTVIALPSLLLSIEENISITLILLLVANVIFIARALVIKKAK